LSVLGYLGAPDGSHAIRDRISGPASAAVAMGEELADAMLSCGGREILDELRDEEIPAPSEP
jgi:porphobilinogen deaminase